MPASGSRPVAASMRSIATSESAPGATNPPELSSAPATGRRATPASDDEQQDREEGAARVGREA